MRQFSLLSNTFFSPVILLKKMTVVPFALLGDPIPDAVILVNYPSLIVTLFDPFHHISY